MKWLHTSVKMNKYHFNYLKSSLANWNANLMYWFPCCISEPKLRSICDLGLPHNGLTINIILNIMSAYFLYIFIYIKHTRLLLMKRAIFQINWVLTSYSLIHWFKWIINNPSTIFSLFASHSYLQLSFLMFVNEVWNLNIYNVSFQNIFKDLRPRAFRNWGNMFVLGYEKLVNRYVISVSKISIYLCQLL